MTDRNIESSTAEVIRWALSAAQSGRIKEACEIGERGLEQGGCDDVALHAMIGALLVRAAEFEQAIPHLQSAHQSRPTDPIIAKNLVAALIDAERFAEALEVISDDLAATDRSYDLLRLRGFAAQMSGELAIATKVYERVLVAEPGDWETWNNLGNTRESAGDLTGAVAALSRAADLNPRAITTRLNLALAILASGNEAEAETQLRQMTAEFPHEAAPWQHLYFILKEQGWTSEAKYVLEGALERDPRNIGMLLTLGREHLHAWEMADAQRIFRSILQFDAVNAEAYVGLADVLERDRPEELPELLAEAERANIDLNGTNLIRAWVARRQKRFREGVEALREVPADFFPVRRWHLLGQLLDGIGEFDMAFDAFSRMNEAQAEDLSKPLARAADLREMLRDQLRRTTAEWRDSWAAPTILAERPAPVFLVGFPRSGTTLLDTIFMGHSDVQVMEERPVLHELSLKTGGFDAIADMNEADVRDAQEQYFQIASKYLQLREGSLLLDKSPLHLQDVPFIYRLFPDARFVLALRHPADAVLSCFIAMFRMNNSMANFLQLDTAAEFYDLSFSMWERGRELFPLEVHTVVYEKVVENPEAVLKPVVEALGLAWQPEMLDHQRTAEARGIITTASYAQVTQPLYRGAVGRWRRYRKHLEPVLPTLAPWIDKLGYEL